MGKLSGVVAIMTDDKGSVIATATDFDRSGYGGYSLAEAQEMRAKDAVGFATINALCSDVVVSVMDRYEVDKIMQALIRKKNWKRTILHVDDTPSAPETGKTDGRES